MQPGRYILKNVDSQGSEKIEESGKRKERKGQRKIEKRNAVNDLASL